MIYKLAFTFLIGLVGAALLHLLIIFLIPVFAQNDAWTKVNSLGEAHQFFTIANEKNSTGLMSKDPFARLSACHFDLNSGPVRISSSVKMPLWSLTIFNKNGDELFSMNDRTSVEHTVDLTILNQLQMLKYRRSTPETLKHSVPIALGTDQGFVVLRTIVADSSWDQKSVDFFADALCETLQLN